MTEQHKATDIYRSPEFREMVMRHMAEPTPEVAAFDDSAPPFTERQRERIAALLNSPR